jgi:dihydroorotase
MSAEPATLLGLPGGRLQVGARADLVLFDLNRTWTVDPASFASKSLNTPFGGWELVGKPVMTLVAGEIRYADPTGAPGWVSASSPNEVPAQ